MRIKKKIFDRKNSLLFSGFLLGIALTGISLIIYLLVPAFTSSNYYKKSLRLLRNQARSIKNEFTHVLTDIEQKKRLISSHVFPSEKAEIFTLLKRFNIQSNTEGIGYLNENGNLILWLGDAVDLETILTEAEIKTLLQQQQSSFLIEHKASVYLISPQRVNGQGYVIFYRLLAFRPQFKTRYVEEYQFLKQKLLKHLQNIRYYDYQEEVSVFERLFTKHKDEYIGQPSLQNEIQTIFFPLRNEKKKIMAVVDLSSPSLSSFVSAQKENIFLVFHILIGLSLVILILYLVKTSTYIKEHKLLLFSLIILTLVGLRFILLSLSHLEKIKSLSIFSPSLASFFSFSNITKSPADIFFTSFSLFLIIICLLMCAKQYIRGKKSTLPFPLSLLINIFLISFSLLFYTIFQRILHLLIFNSNINLLRFTFSLSSLLLHLSILSISGSFFLLIYAALRIASRYTSHFFFSFSVLVLLLGGYCIISRVKNSYLFCITQFIVVSIILVFAFFPELLKKRRVIASACILGSLIIFLSLNHYSSAKVRSLIQHSLKNTVIAQKEWGNFLAGETLDAIEDRRESIIGYFQNPVSPDFAQSLWKETLASKFNWYSSLEIWNAEGEILSRFSLNVPQLYPSDFTLSSSKEWLISHQNIPFMGSEKNLLIGFKDWFDDGTYLGRMTLTLSVDYDMLPFLYSAHPYFELIRVTTLPSLNQFNFGFAVYDLAGRILFNPNKISQGIPLLLLERINSTEKSVWSSFQDKNKNFNAFYFRTDNRIYLFFLPKKSVINFTVEFLRLLFLYTALFLFTVLIVNITFEKKKIKNPLWSFSSKVYASFISIAIIPLIFFTFFTRGFFERIFSEQFIEKAEVHANFAYRVMEDFIFMQEEEKVTPIAPPEDLVLWISSTISNDVNLYQDGRLASSSRREFYDSGLLPELIDGEIYFKAQSENNPFYTQKQRIGNYSFHTLTVPFFYLDSLFLISLPFPFEQQEIANASEEFIEFLVFISVFFVGVVLIFAQGAGTMIITPIKKLLAGTKEVGLGNLKVSIEHKPQDEMKTLIDGFNSMIKNLRKHQQELADLSQKVAWGEMARKVAHEVKNPLTPIQLSAEHLLKVYADKKGDFDKTLKESASYIIKEVEHLRKTAQEFLDISRQKTLQKEPFDLKNLVKETVSPFKKTLSERIKFKEVYEEKDFQYEGDKAKLRIALRNIIINAIEAIRNKGEIEVSLRRRQNSFSVEIGDTGTGMEKDMKEKIFEPSFSTKDVGTGLGLPISRKIIEDHEGTIKISSVLGKGTKIMIKLPFFCEE